MLKKLYLILFNKQFHNLSIYGIGQGFNLVTPLLVIPYIISICGEENFGKSSVGMAISFFLMVFIDYGSDIIGVREVSINRDNNKTLQQILFSTYYSKIVLLFIVAIVSIIIFMFIPFFKSDQTLFFFGISVLVGQFLNPTWFLQGIENVKWITISNIISKIIYVIFIFIFIKKESDYVYINLFWGLGMILTNGFFLLLIIKTFGFELIKFRFSDVLSFLKKDFKMFSSQVFVSIQMYSPILLISFFGNNLMAGQFKIVEQVIVIFKTYILLFFNFVFPKICFLLDKNPKKALFHWKIYNGSNFLFIAVSMIIIYLFSYEIVSYFNPTNRYFLSRLLEIAIFYPLLFAVSIPLKQLVLGWNHQRFYINTTTITVILNVFLIVFLMPKFKVYGVFYSLIIIEVIVILFYLLCIKKNWLQITKDDKNFISRATK
ncbi:MAG: oligosaccharide flippase family protein [Flavobacterium sp.]|nr:oligosaccharide flippase family protein [Flavobacterium sp.]